MTRVTVNETNKADDERLIKLQKEIQHLKEILNLKRNGGANELI